MDQAAIALAPSGAAPAPRRRPAAATLLFAAVLLATLAFELALAERKYAVFGGGFGQSRALDAPAEIVAFLAALLATHVLLFYLLYRLLRRLHGRHADRPVFLYNFAWIAGAGGIALLVGKYQALSYFSDAMSFQIVRNLGGGSIVQALLYVLSEAALPLILAGGAVLLYAAGLALVRRRWGDAPPLAEGPRIGGAALAAAVLAIGPLLFAANRVDDARSALTRFNAPFAASFLLHHATDFDRDGWSFFSHPIDRQPFNPARHPYAVDADGPLPDEGPDGPAIVPEPRPHVVLVVLESARGDLLGRRYRGRPIAPTLEALARSGSWAPEAYSHVGFTTNSLKSLFTGALDPVDDRRSLFRDFDASGYAIGIFSGQADDFGDMATTVGMRRFADVYVDARELRDQRAFNFTALASLAVDGRVLLREFDRHYGDPARWHRPNFLYFNFQSAHFPYHMPGMDRILPGEPIPRRRISAENRAWVERTYWNAIAYNDRLLAELIARLKRLDVYDDVLLVVTSDHGESLFDDGFLGHGHMLNRQQTHIPLILNRPGVDLDRPIGLADFRALILEAAGAGPAPLRRRVFQYLGGIERPGAIGFVEQGERRTILNLARGDVWTSGEGRWVRRDALGAEDAARVAELEEEWMGQRRLRLSRTRNGPGSIEAGAALAKP